MRMAWKSIILVPLREVLERVGNFIPTLVGVLVILIGGWMIAKFVQRVVVQVLKAIKLDQAAEKTKIDVLLAKGDVKQKLSELIGVLLYWLMMLIIFMAAVNALGLTVTADLLNRVIGYLPNVIAAVFILVLGIFFSTLLASIVQTAATNAGIRQAKVISQLVQVVIVVFASVIVLEQLSVAAYIITFTLQAIIAALALAAGLAFGLGCKDIAADTTQDIINKLKKK